MWILERGRIELFKTEYRITRWDDLDMLKEWETRIPVKLLETQEGEGRKEDHEIDE